VALRPVEPASAAYPLPEVVLRERALRRADGIICVSEHTKTDLLRLYPVGDKPVLVAPHGNSLRQTTPVAPDVSGPFFLYVGTRAVAYKNYALLLKTFARNERLKPFALVCFGGGAFTPTELAAIRLSYPKISATAGPCGVWPEDLGPSIKNKSYIENKSYYNFGCAYQRNMAAMIDNPADLVQPRPETPPYTMRRTEAFEKYRKGATTATTYPEADKAKLSDTGK